MFSTRQGNAMQLAYPKVQTVPADAASPGEEWLKSIEVHTDEVVNELADMAHWSAYDVKQIYQRYGLKALESMQEFFHDSTYSTAFSGIDTPGTAIKQLELSLEKFSQKLIFCCRS